MKNKTIAESPLLTFNEACAYLRVSRSSLYRLINSGHLTPVRVVGRRPLFPKNTLDEMISRLTHGGSLHVR